jgi:hypothetical protein
MQRQKSPFGLLAVVHYVNRFIASQCMFFAPSEV